MLANAHARIREIGIRKALGARRRNILHQTLAETLMILGSGGVVGAVIGVVISVCMHGFTDYAIPISVWSVLSGLGAAGLVGVAFSTYPAVRAAYLNPVEALRYE